MVQGVNTSKFSKFPSNKKSVAGALRRKSTALGPKKGGRVIAPKKRPLLKQQKITKKYSSGLTAMTERTLGARVGHLELLGHASDGKTKEGSNGDVKGRNSKGKKTNQTVSSQCGSKKFG